MIEVQNFNIHLRSKSIEPNWTKYFQKNRDSSVSKIFRLYIMFSCSKLWNVSNPNQNTERKSVMSQGSDKGDDKIYEKM